MHSRPGLRHLRTRGAERTVNSGLCTAGAFSVRDNPMRHQAAGRTGASIQTLPTGSGRCRHDHHDERQQPA